MNITFFLKKSFVFCAGPLFSFFENGEEFIPEEETGPPFGDLKNLAKEYFGRTCL